MGVRYLFLGVLLGVLASAVAVAAGVALLARRPLPELPAPSPGPVGDIAIVVQEGYLGKLATELAHEQEPMIQQVVVDVQPEGRVDMILAVQITVLGRALDLQVRLITAVRVDDAHLRFDVQKIEFAGLNIPLDLLPESLRTTLETTVVDVNERANRMLGDSGLVPVGVSTDASSITVSLRSE